MQVNTITFQRCLVALEHAPHLLVVALASIRVVTAVVCVFGQAGAYGRKVHGRMFFYEKRQLDQALAFVGFLQLHTAFTSHAMGL